MCYTGTCQYEKYPNGRNETCYCTARMQDQCPLWEGRNKVDNEPDIILWYDTEYYNRQNPDDEFDIDSRWCSDE